MAIRKIVNDKDPQLRKHSRDVDVFDGKLHKILDDMRDTMRDAEGVGLAAPQIGILRNYVVIEVGDIYLELINPKIVSSEGSQTGQEGCLSVPNKLCEITRPNIVTVEYKDRYGSPKKITVSELIARACCHEIDHLFGILFYDRADKK